MSRTRKYLTREGYQRLAAEYDELRNVVRPEVVQRISDAAAEGDRSENAEYIYGKKRLRELDSRLRYLDGLLDDVKVEPHETFAIVCGPPVMFKFVCQRLSRMGIPMDRMFVSLERRMHCGMGKCCRCNVGSTYTCTHGPVFDYWTVINLKEAI